MFAKQLIHFENIIFMNLSKKNSFSFKKNVLGKKLKLNINPKSKIACAQVTKVP
jgi:hypothetical protein